MADILKDAMRNCGHIEDYKYTKWRGTENSMREQAKHAPCLSCTRERNVKRLALEAVKMGKALEWLEKHGIDPNEATIDVSESYKDSAEIRIFISTK